MSVDWAAVAAWVQAVGALLAIGVAVAIASRQDRTHIEREQIASRARIVAALAILGACDECLGKAAGKIRYGRKAQAHPRSFSPYNIDATIDDFAACTERLASIPIFDLPDEKLVQVIVHARLLMDTGKRRVARVREQLEAGQVPDRDFDELQMQLRDCLRQAGHEAIKPRKALKAEEG